MWCLEIVSCPMEMEHKSCVGTSEQKNWGGAKRRFVKTGDDDAKKSTDASIIIVFKFETNNWALLEQSIKKAGKRSVTSFQPWIEICNWIYENVRDGIYYTHHFKAKHFILSLNFMVLLLLTRINRTHTHTQMTLHLFYTLTYTIHF